MNKITKKPSAHLLISKLANLLISLRPAHLLIPKFANLLIFLLILFGCTSYLYSQSPSAYYIELTTQKSVGDSIRLFIKADSLQFEKIWIDLNNNGKWDKKIDKKPVKTEKFNYQYYFIESQTIRIYGQVKKLYASDNKLTAIDISHNPALRTLEIRCNNLPYIKHLEHLEELDLDVHTLPNTNLPNLKKLTATIGSTAPTIDFKAFANLEYLSLSFLENLKTLDLSKNTNLKELSIHFCDSIKSLDLSKNSKLEDLYLSYLHFTELDVSNNPNISYLNISEVPLRKLNIKNCKNLKFLQIPTYYDDDDHLIGFTGKELMKILKLLPTGGYIYLSPEQLTEDIEKYLKKKNWRIEVVGKEIDDDSF
jgi:leucine rich repeat domain protein